MHELRSRHSIVCAQETTGFMPLLDQLTAALLWRRGKEFEGAASFYNKDVELVDET